MKENYKEKIKWRIIEDFPNYEVSSDGDVRNIKIGNILKQTNNGNGYLYVYLYDNNNRKKFLVHRLVAIAFLEDTGINPDGTPMVGKHVVNRAELLQETDGSLFSHTFTAGNIIRRIAHESQ